MPRKARLPRFDIAWDGVDLARGLGPGERYTMVLPVEDFTSAVEHVLEARIRFLWLIVQQLYALPKGDMDLRIMLRALQAGTPKDDILSPFWGPQADWPALGYFAVWTNGMHSEVKDCTARRATRYPLEALWAALAACPAAGMIERGLAGVQVVFYGAL